MITIQAIDHFVLTVASIDTSCEFYASVLGMQVETFGEGRKALRFGSQKINLHQIGKEFEPKAKRPTTGSADFCLIVATPIKQVIKHLGRCRVEIEQGPITRTGAEGPIVSVYIRDPDENLVEISNRS